MYTSQITVLCTFNLYSAVCQFYHNKTGRKKPDYLKLTLKCLGQGWTRNLALTNFYSTLYCSSSDSNKIKKYGCKIINKIVIISRWYISVCRKSQESTDGVKVKKTILFLSTRTIKFLKFRKFKMTFINSIEKVIKYLGRFSRKKTTKCYWDNYKWFK